MRDITLGQYVEEVKRMIGPNKAVMDYFIGHYERFALTFGIFEKHLKHLDIKDVADIGTWMPFSSIYFSLVNDAMISCFCPQTEEALIVQDDRAKHVDFNLNFPVDTGLHDLVICTECLEHIPSSMTRARDFLWSQVKPGGFLFVSCPCYGVNAKDYDLDMPGYDYNVAHPHIREFTEATADKFLQPLGGKLIDKAFCQTQLYQAPMFHYLLQKEAHA